MKQLLYSLFLVLSFLHVTAQQKDSINCPVIKLEGPRGNSISDGKEASVSVRSFKKEFLKTHTISYEWITINGLITGGKDKSTVYIDTKGLAGQQIKAAVLINGLDPGCPASATMLIDVIPPGIIRTEQQVIGKRVY